MRQISTLRYRINLCRTHFGCAWLLALAFANSGHAVIDANTNGMSDVWEVAYSVTNGNPTADPDGDGQNNLDESIAGTNPFDAESTFRVTQIQYVQSALLAHWTSVAGKRYQLESTPDLISGPWTRKGPVIEGTGGSVTALATQSNPPIMGLRVRLLEDDSAVLNGRPDLLDVDTDQDGSADIDEWAAGTAPFDGSSYLGIAGVEPGSAVVLSWDSVRGKLYSVESAADPASATWTTEAGPIQGTDTSVSCVIKVDSNKRWFRLVVADSDSDSDGVTDWEESIAGLEFRPWNFRTNFPTDPATISALLTASNVVNIEPFVPVADATRGTPGSFRITRTGNLDKLTIHYTIAGDATPGTQYEPLTGSVTLQPGEHSAEIPVTPMSEVGLAPSKSVILTLSPSTNYTLGTNSTAQVNVLREVALSVTDYGAVGDGITDDTLPIRAAIDALEASTSHNTLHFPAGTYRLNTPVWVSGSSANWYQLLELGKTDLGGRDILFTGAIGAVLYSTTSPLRCHILVAQASFRSLQFHDLTWQKDANPLALTTSEPVNADGVRIVYHDQRRVEEVAFLNCRFNNCHRAVTTSFNVGYDTRGLLRHFRFIDCTVLNPFGSNTIDGQKSFGGGQQLAIGPWVDNALYADCFFDGGTNGVVDPVRNPGGIRMDGSHFGGPLNLIFTNNIVQRMGIEGVFQTDEAFIAATAGPITFPPPDGTTTATVLLYPAVSTFVPGHVLNFRTPLTPTSDSKNVFLTIVSYDPDTRVLTVTNPGLTPGVEGTTLNPSRPIYLQDYNPSHALIADNLIATDPPAGTIGIASSSRAVIARNFIKGYYTGIQLYENVRNPLNPPTPGTILDSNVVLTQDTSGGAPGVGVRAWGPGEIISGNLIVTPLSYRFVGTTVHGTNAWVEGNTVLPIQVIRNGYSSTTRAVGIGFANGSSNNTSVANSTYGMDVGNGPEDAFQPAFRRVISHYSTNDVLAVDPVALVP